MTKSQIKSVLNAAINGPFFVDKGNKENQYWEFQTLIGATHAEILTIYESDDFDYMGNPEIVRIVQSIIVNLEGYPHRKESDILKWIPDWNEIRQNGFDFPA